MRAIIQAGGSGTRLRPVTYETPKPLLTVHKKPIIDHIIEFLKQQGIHEIGVVISAEHHDDFRKWLDAAPGIAGKNISLFVEAKPSGTFGWLRNLKKWLGNNPFILVNGDTLLDFTIDHAMEVHRKHKPIVTVALMSVENPGDYGAVAVGENNYIVSFVEKPKNIADPSLVSAGFYIVEPSVFEYDQPERDFLMIEHDIFPALTNAKKIAGAIVKGRFFDCGTFERWEAAIREW